MPTFQVQVSSAGQPPLSLKCDSAVEFGRQRPNEPAPLALISDVSPKRIVIAAATERRVSREHVRIEALKESSVQLINTSKNRSIILANGNKLGPKERMQHFLPLELVIGGSEIRVSSDRQSSAMQMSEGIEVLTLNHIAPRPGQEHYQARTLTAEADSKFATNAQLIEWLSLAMNVLQSAANESNFLEKAAETAMEIVGLDAVAVVMWENGEWKTRAANSKVASQHVQWEPSQTILDQVRESARTVRHLPQLGNAPVSLMGVEALVAAPILNKEGVVVGTLYGDRRMGLSQPNISELDAILVELLASGVAAGLARVEHERAAMEARVQFERYFTPSLAQHLMANPRLLEGRDADVSILFCDIRGFSRLSQKLGPAKTMNLVGDVMDELSDLVFAEDGVLVDYIGDELIAMWGAPEARTDHAMCACRAALSMLEGMPKMNEKWRELIGEQLCVGIGICSGPAHVGNTGSSRKFKYGPLGNTVNLASRIQGATKYFRTDLLISDTTADSVRDEFCLRRLANVQVVNIPTPFSLYEVMPITAARSEESINRYERALTAFESGDYVSALSVLAEFKDAIDDGPRQVLRARIEAAQATDAEESDSIWELPGK